MAVPTLGMGSVTPALQAPTTMQQVGRQPPEDSSLPEADGPEAVGRQPPEDSSLPEADAPEAASPGATVAALPHQAAVLRP